MIRIHGHALKHGLTAGDVSFAWNNLIRSRQRNGSDDPPLWIGIGILPDGRLVEMVAFLDEEDNWCVFHAMTPPTTKFIRELQLTRRHHGGN